VKVNDDCRGGRRAVVSTVGVGVPVRVGLGWSSEGRGGRAPTVMFQAWRLPCGSPGHRNVTNQKFAASLCNALLFDS
jgi:hypothetical protein